MTNIGLIERARQMLNAASNRPSQQHHAHQQNVRRSSTKFANRNKKVRAKPIWMETEACVSACRGVLPKANAFCPGGPDLVGRFLVSFSYYAHARTYFDSSTFSEAKGQDERFSIFYNALNPQQNTKSLSGLESKRLLTPVGIAGYIILSGLLLTMIRG